MKTVTITKDRLSISRPYTKKIQIDRILYFSYLIHSIRYATSVWKTIVIHLDREDVFIHNWKIKSQPLEEFQWYSVQKQP